MASLTRLLGPLLVAALAAGVLGVTAQSSSARQPSAGGQIEIASQTAWVEAEGAFNIETVADAPPGATVEFTVHNRVTNRLAFQSSIDDGPTTSLLFSASETVPTSGIAGTSILVSAERDPDRVLLRDPGVYPVEVSLLDLDGTRLDRLTTHIIRVPETLEDEVPLAVAITLPIDTGVALQPNGTRDLSAASLGNVESLLSALPTAPQQSVSIAIQPETLAALAPETVRSLSNEGSDQLILTQSFVDLDATAWFDAGLDSEYISAVGAGASTTTDLVAPPDMSVWLAADTLTPSTLARLGGLGYRALVVSEDALSPLDEAAFPLTLTQQFLVEDVNGQPYQAGSIDETMSDRFPRGIDSTLAGHQALADLAVLFFDQPGINRGVIMSPPPDWTVDATFLRVVFDGLAGNPILDSVTLAQWFEQVSVGLDGGQNADLGFDLQRELEPAPGADLALFSTRYGETAADLFSYGGIVGPDSTTLQRLNSLLLIAGSQDLSPGQSDQYLAAISEAINETTDLITVLDPPNRVTFADRDGAIPILIDNNFDATVSLLIAMTSDKLTFPDGQDLVFELEPGINEISLPVSARTSGDSVLDLRISSPDRSIELYSSRVTVRSTSLSGVGVVIAVIALLFLLIWWLRTHRTRRPDPRLVRKEPSAEGNVAEPVEV